VEWHLTGENQNTRRKILSQSHFTHHISQRAYLYATTMGSLQVTNSATAQFTVNITSLVSYLPFVGFNSVTQRDVRISQVILYRWFNPTEMGHRNVVTNRRNLKDG